MTKHHKETMTTPILTIKMNKPAVELALSALATLPYNQSAGLIKEIEAQANYQLQQMQEAAEAAAQPVAEEPTQEPIPQPEGN
jgi:hypothetical protein